MKISGSSMISVGISSPQIDKLSVCWPSLSPSPQPSPQGEEARAATPSEVDWMPANAGGSLPLLGERVGVRETAEHYCHDCSRNQISYQTAKRKKRWAAIALFLSFLICGFGRAQPILLTNANVHTISGDTNYPGQV